MYAKGALQKLAAALSTAAFLSFLIFFQGVSPSIPVNNAGKYTPTIIVDAGHGGVDGGATSIYGDLEKDINLSIALNFKQLLEASGFKVIMIREGDYSIHDEDANSIRKKKMTDLNNRLKLVNSTDNAVLVSIHQNIYGVSKYSGAQVFYSPNNPLSKVMAEIFQAKIIEMIQPQNTRKTKQCTKDIFLLYNATPPAILVECGFLSNPEEAAKLKDPKYQKKFAFVLLCALLSYCEQAA